MTIDIKRVETDLADRNGSLDTLSTMVGRAAVKNYVYEGQGSSSNIVVTIGSSNAADAAERQGYASALVGSVVDAVDRLQAARDDTDTLRRDLAERLRKQALLKEKLDSATTTVTANQTKLSLLAVKVNGELVQLVAEEEQRQREAAAARAQAEVDRQRAELAKQAEQQRAAQVAQARLAAARNVQVRTPAPASSPSPAPGTGQSAGAAPPTPNDEPPPPAPTSSAGVAVAEALRQLGKPYVFGTNGPNTFDCSGLTQWAWAKAGVYMDHFTGSQAKAFPRVSVDQLQPGDLVFFNVDLGHMGMYIGNGQIVQAPQTGDVVKISSLSPRNVVVAVRPG